MDIIGLIFSVVGIYLNARKVIWNWYVLFIANVFWLTHYLIKDEITSAILMIIFMGMNIYGILSWAGIKWSHFKN